MNDLLILNIGSKNKKYAHYTDGVQKLYTEYETSNKQALSDFIKTSHIPLDAHVAIRIVAPGPLFRAHRAIDSEYIDALIEASTIAPLHIFPTIDEIRILIEEYPHMKLFGISDSAFHASMPQVAKTYAIPEHFRTTYHIERQGYHGLSLTGVISQLQTALPSLPSKIIVCHLGGGTSVTAIKDGLSIDTSMGFTPLEGAIMAERSGNIDPGVIALLSSILRKEDTDIASFLSHDCGLEALSKIEGGNMKDLLSLRETNKDVQHSIDCYIYSIRKEIGRMYAALNGCDLLVCTGTIGLRSYYIRSSLIKDLGSLNLSLDEIKNQQEIDPPSIAFIGPKGNEQRVAIVPTNEMKILAQELEKIAK